MKTTDFIKEGIGEDADAMHRDHEVQMARGDCYNAAKYAIELHKMLHHVAETQGLDGWVSEKITLANDYLRTVWEYLSHEMAMDDQPDLPVFSFESADKQFNSILEEGSLGTSPDRLLARTGINIAHKVPRAGQTNMGNIPAGNLDDRHKEYMDKQRDERSSKLKSAIKGQLGKHRAPDLPEGVAEGIEQPREAGKAIQSLKIFAVMKTSLTMQQLSQAGREAIVTNAIDAAKTLEQTYLQNKQQGNAIFVRALRDEIDNFMRGAPINASFPETDNASELGDLLQGKLGKVNFQQGVAEVSDATLTSYLTKVDADSQKHEKDPTKRSAEKRNRSVQGFSRAFNKLDARKEKVNEIDPRNYDSDWDYQAALNRKSKRYDDDDVDLPDDEDNFDPDELSNYEKYVNNLPEGKQKAVKESASVGGISAGAVATGPAGGAGKPGTGVPKKVGNVIKRNNPKFGKGIY